jgi:hypothetical protein
MTSPVIGERAGRPPGANAAAGTPRRSRIARASSATPDGPATGFNTACDVIDISLEQGRAPGKCPPSARGSLRLV